MDHLPCFSLMDTGKPSGEVLGGILKDLRATPSDLTSAAKERVLLRLLSMIGDADLSEHLVYQSLQYYGKIDDTAARLLSMCNDTTHPQSSDADFGIQQLISCLPQLNMEFVDSFVRSFVPQVVDTVRLGNARALDYLCFLLNAVPKTASQICDVSFTGENHINLGIVIGKGKFGLVWKGVNKNDGTLVAIKQIQRNALVAGLNSDSAAKVLRLLKNEMDVLQRMSHYSVLRLYEIEESDKCIDLVTEYVPGGDLKQYLKEHGQLSEQETRHWLRQLASGLRYLKNEKVIHRDLKPDNILMTSPDMNGQLKIADFGFARFIGENSLAETQLGTPLYMAPEMIANIPYSDTTDLWAVGVIIYQMLTGRLPYMASSISQLIKVITMGPPKPPTGVSAEIQDLVLRLLREPEKRISWADFFAHPALAEETHSDVQQLQKELQQRNTHIRELEAMMEETKLHYEAQLAEKDAAFQEICEAYDLLFDKEQHNYRNLVSVLNQKRLLTAQLAMMN
eukprot:TRINITY_DN1604_c0_g2_i1.p1 TRINITY_DN1604_c0_g2~~TRINITY_DN1604_c0_g2_i1.p1  ORF type:complete len:518 (+),score=102.78 TRINITY_DN1604_c0_g2_i1:30-1556(+)